MTQAVPPISVLTCIWKAPEEYLRRTIRSVLEQSYSDFEYIIVEDPSDTVSRDVVESFDDERIRYVLNDDRSSLIEQRNQAVSMARGKYFAWIDGDDICRVDRLALQRERMLDDANLDVLGSWLSIIDESGETLGMREYPVDHEAICKVLHRTNPIAQPSVMARTEAVRACGYQYGRYIGCEDYDVWCQLYKKGARFANFDQPLTMYRIQLNQLKWSKMHDLFNGTWEIQKNHFPDHQGGINMLRRCAQSVMLWLPTSIVRKIYMSMYVSRSKGAASAKASRAEK